MVRRIIINGCVIGFLLVGCNGGGSNKSAIKKDSLPGASDTAVTLNNIEKVTAATTPARNNKAGRLGGIWVKVGKNGIAGTDGFNLKDDETATSLNTPAIKYEGWEHPSDKELILKGNKVVNKKTSSFKDIYTIKTLNDSILEISRDKEVSRYRRM